MKKLICKAIPGYEGLYEADIYGNIYSLNYERTGIRKKLKGSIVKRGSWYRNVLLVKNKKGKQFLISRLIAITFIPNPLNKPEVNHKDANTFNNNVSNLEWATRMENMHHAFSSGLRDPNGIGNFNKKVVINKITKKEYLGVRECYDKENVKVKYGISYRTFGNMISGTTSNKNKTIYEYK